MKSPKSLNSKFLCLTLVNSLRRILKLIALISIRVIYSEPIASSVCPKDSFIPICSLIIAFIVTIKSVVSTSRLLGFNIRCIAAIVSYTLRVSTEISSRSIYFINLCSSEAQAVKVCLSATVSQTALAASFKLDNLLKALVCASEKSSMYIFFCLKKATNISINSSIRAMSFSLSIVGSTPS